MPIICQNCSKEVSEWAKFCNFCGVTLQKSETTASTVPAGAAMSCPACHRNYASGTLYCPADGEKLVKAGAAPAPACPVCGTVYGEDVKYCTADGTRLTSQAAGLYSAYEMDTRAYPKASPGKRFGGALLDSLLVMLLSAPALFCFFYGVIKATHYESDSSTYYLLALLLYMAPLAYAMIKDGLGTGQSIGKKAVEIMVVDLAENAPCSKAKSFLRNFVTNVVFIIPYYIYFNTRSPFSAMILFLVAMIDPILVLTRDDGRKIGDLAANTQVIDQVNYRRNRSV